MSTPQHTTDDESNGALAERVEELEQKVDSQLELEADDGKMLSFDRLLNLGLTRRQSFAALGYVAIGMSSVGAIAKAIGTVQAQSSEPDAIYGLDQIGTSDDPVSDLYVDALHNVTETDNATFESVSADESRTDSRTVTINVPTDFLTVSSALDEIRSLRHSPGLKFDINIETGYEITDPIRIENESFRHVSLVAEDTTVAVSDSFPSEENVIEIQNGESFYYDLKIDAGSNGANGIRANTASSFVARGTTETGLINAGEHGILIDNGSTCFAYANDFSGAGTDCARVVRASQATFGGAFAPNFSGAGQYGLYADRSSIVRTTGGDFSNAGSSAIRCADGAVVAASGADCTGAGSNAIRCTYSGLVEAHDADLSNAVNQGALAIQGGRINLIGATIVDCGTALQTNEGFINARGATATGSSGNDIQVQNGGHIIANSVETSSSTGSGPHESDVDHMGFDETSGMIFGDFETA